MSLAAVRARPIVRTLVLGLAALTLSACETFRHKAPQPSAPIVQPPPAAPGAPRIYPPPPAPLPPPPKASCVPKTLAHPPKYPDTDAALREAGGAADRYQLLAAGRLLRMQRLNELEKVIDGCR